MPTSKDSSSESSLDVELNSALHASGETGRPPKRARTETATPSSSNTLSRDESLYFEDGNVIVVTENVAFRVHRGQLSRHSEVIAEKLAMVKGAEKYDGCPVLRLLYPVESVRHLLTALYDGFSPSNNSDHEYLRDILVLSTEYRIKKLREKALEVLTIHNPDTLHNFISARGPSPPDPCYTLCLALQTNSRRLLPTAYYNVCCTPHSKVLEGLALQKDLNLAYWVNLMKGRAALADWLALFLNSRLQLCLQQSCCSTSATPCWIKLTEIKKSYLAAAAQPSHIIGSILSPQPFMVLTKIREGLNTTCPSCQQTTKQYLSSAMQELWTQLPILFGLEPWDKLHN